MYVSVASRKGLSESAFSPGFMVQGFGMIHGMMPIHEGMTIRLLEAVCVAHGLFRGTEGVVVRVVVNPMEEDNVKTQVDENPIAQVFLQYMPLGIFVRISNYSKSVLKQTVNGSDDNREEREELGSIIYLEPQLVKFHLFGIDVTRSGCSRESYMAARG